VHAGLINITKTNPYRIARPENSVHLPPRRDYADHQNVAYTTHLCIIGETSGYPCWVEQEATNRLTGAVHGAAIQAHTIHGGVHVHVGTDDDAAAPSVADTPPSGWDDLPVLPPEVRSLLRAQIQAAKDLPYRLPGARRPSLETVYVRQDLGSGIEDPPSEQQRPIPILDSRGQLVDASTGPVMRVAVRPPARTVREALDDDYYLLITGGPGQGKSTLSLRLAATVAEHWLSAKPDPDTAPLAEPVLPLRLPARELAARLDLPFPEALAKSAANEYNRLLTTPPTARTLQERVLGCHWLLLVDGLDEIADSTDRDRLVTALTGWASQDGSPYRFVLTTRPIEGAALAPLQRIGAARYELQPFDEKALRRFADHWFADADLGYRFVRQIRAAHLDELVRVPLLATIAAIVFEQHGTRPLPDNQYELYESYLKYLHAAHPIAPCPFDHICDPLLEHLGRVRLDLDTSLLTAAREWVDQQIPNLTGDWEEELVTYLTAVAPLTWRSDDLRFLHHSFAEHLAATAEARLLPERFDPGAPDFARLLHVARLKERGQHARAVLLHYTRLHASEADRLIGWLHAADAEQHLLAARLLAAHTPAGVNVVDAFLATVRAWAMTTQYLAEDILEQASRAAHHPGIAEWLADLMREEKAPWESRIVAATALSTRLRGPGAAKAITLLRAVVDDAAIPVKHRLAAAEALSEYGVEERGASERGLRSVLADPDATGWNCRTAAVVLASFGGAARAHAITALIDMLDNPWVPDNDLAEIASGLVEIGVEFHERCAEVFRTILDRRTILPTSLRDAAIGLASLGPQHLINAVTTLTSIIDNRSLDRDIRLRTATVLAELGPQHRLAAGKYILAISTECDVEPHERWDIAHDLAEVGLYDQGVTLLRAALKGHDLSPNNRLWAARELVNIGPDHRNEAVSEFHRVANDPRSGEYDRAAALAELAAFGEPHRTPAIAALRGILADGAAAPSFRCAAGRELIQLGPEFHREVVEHVVEIASYYTDPSTRAAAWHMLRNLDRDLRLRASAELRELARPDTITLWESHRGRWIPSHYLNALDPESTAAALIAVLREPNGSGDTQRRAASALMQLSRRFHRVALDGLIALLRARSTPSARLSIFGTDAPNLGPQPRAELAEALCEVAHTPFTTPDELCGVVDALEQLGHRPPPKITTALRAIVRDDMADPDSRADSALALLRAEPEELTEVAVIVLRSLGKWPISWEFRVRKLAALQLLTEL
jgi:cellulose synthase operon protein C